MGQSNKLFNYVLDKFDSNHSDLKSGINDEGFQNDISKTLRYKMNNNEFTSICYRNLFVDAFFVGLIVICISFCFRLSWCLLKLVLNFQNNGAQMSIYFEFVSFALKTHK